MKMPPASGVWRLPAVMRKSIDGLCAIVLDYLKTEPDGCSIIFCGKRCDRIKIFLHEPDGFVLLLNVLMWYEEGAAGQETGVGKINVPVSAYQIW